MEARELPYHAVGSVSLVMSLKDGRHAPYAVSSWAWHRSRRQGRLRVDSAYILLFVRSTTELSARLPSLVDAPRSICSSLQEENRGPLVR